MSFDGSRVEGKTLYPLDSTRFTPFDNSQFRGKLFAEVLLERLREHIAKSGDGPWLINGAKRATGSSNVFGAESYNLAEVEPRARQMSRILRHHYGIGKGDVVHFVMPGNSEMYFPVIGTWLLQGVVSPADPSLAPEVLRSQMEDAKAKLVICCAATLDKVRKATDDIPILVMDEVDNMDLNAGQEKILSSLYQETSQLLCSPTAEEVEENELMLIGWSSGTTGRPKGILFGSDLFLKLFTQQSMGGIALQTTCFFHLGGFTSPLHTLMNGCTTVFLAPEDLDADISLMLDVAAKTSATSIMCGSHHLIQVAALTTDLPPASTVGLLVPVGTNIYPGIFEDIKAKFPAAFAVLEIYGQSEGGCAVSICMGQESMGGVRCPAVRIVDPDTGEILGAGMVGEITYKSDTHMIGYLNHPEENARFFGGGEGFLRSGDLGHYDDKGNLYFDGRIKELIKYKNFHLYPNELEEIILKLDGVEDAAVFGRPEPSVQELVTALVVRKTGAELRAEEVQEAVDGKVDDHKKLRGGVSFVDKIPRNPQGKILRRKLNQLLT